MFERNQRIELIRKRFSEFDVYIQSSNKGGLFDINRHAEEISREILNVAYGYELKNLNFSEKINFPIIDLGDEKQGVCFQVTSNKTNFELKQIQDRFKIKGLDIKYPKLFLFFLSIGNNSQKVKNAIQQSGLPESQVLDFDTILLHLQSLGSEGDEQIERVLASLDANYIRYTYLEEAETNYFKGCKDRFDTKDFVEPFLMEERPNVKPPDDEWESSHLSNQILIKREVGKIKLGKLLNRVNQLVITGNPGTGKSELVKDFFNSLIDNDKRYLSENIFPVYLRLTNKYSVNKIEDQIRNEIKKHVPSIGLSTYDQIIDELIRKHLNKGTLCLILDGYDELDIPELREWNEALKIFFSQNSKTLVILTVRKNRITTDIHLPIQHYYDVLPFDDSQVHKYVSNLAQKLNITDEKLTSQITEKITQSKLHIKEPALVIKMIVESELSNNHNSLKSKAVIYKAYFENLIANALLQKGIADISRLGDLVEKLIEASFRTLSFISHSNSLKGGNYGDTSFITSELNKVLKKIEAESTKGLLFSKGVNFFIEDLKIIQKIDGKLLFTHFTFQEFFFAIAIHKKVFGFRSPTLRWIKAAYSISKYNQVFLFLMGLFSEKECEKFIRKFLKWPIRHKLQLCSLLEVFTQSKYYFLGEIACEGKLTDKRKAELVDKMILRLDAGDPLHFPKVCRILSLLEPGSEIIFRKILLALEKKSHYNRREGLTIYAVASIAHNSNIIELMKEQLYHGDGYVRGAAIMFFGQAQHFDRQIIDRAIELASVEKAYNSIDTQNMIVSLAQVSPESCIPYIESWKKNGKEKYRGTEYDIWCSFMEYYSGQILNVPQYKEQEYEGRILRYLDKTHVDMESRANLAKAIGKSGIRSEGVIPTLIQMIRNDDEISASCLMAFRDAFIVKPEITEQAIRLLESEILYNRIRAMNYLSEIQHITKVIYNGKDVELTTMVEDLFFKYKNEQHSSFLGYAIEYMGKANHKNSKLEDTILKAALSQRSEVLSDIETLIRYLVNVNHFSPTFIGLLLSYQRITEHLDMSCYAANSFFENIERHIPQEKHKFMKDVLRDFCFENIVSIWKLRKYLLSNDSEDMWADQQAERLYRTGLALQKIVLCEDEAKKRIGIS